MIWECDELSTAASKKKLYRKEKIKNIFYNAEHYIFFRRTNVARIKMLWGILQKCAKW